MSIEVMKIESVLNETDIRINSTLKVNDMTIKSSFNEGGKSYPIYDGETDIIPRKIEQELNTEKKVLATNIVVKPIDRKEVTNPGGGQTIIIGKE